MEAEAEGATAAATAVTETLVIVDVDTITTTEAVLTQQNPRPVTLILVDDDATMTTGVARTQQNPILPFGNWIVNSTTKSIWWKHFNTRQFNKTLAKCVICDIELKVNDSGTGTLKNHMLSTHKPEYDKIKEAETKNKTAQAPITTFLQPADNHRNHNDFLVKYMVKNYVHLSLVDNVEFVDFVHALNPRAKIIHLN